MGGIDLRIRKMFGGKKAVEGGLVPGGGLEACGAVLARSLFRPTDPVIRPRNADRGRDGGKEVPEMGQGGGGIVQPLKGDEARKEF